MYMSDITKIKSIATSSFVTKSIFVVITFILFTIIFWISPPDAADWHRAFYQVSKIPFHPYDVELFINTPWTALILYPFHYFPENISLAINTSLNLVIIGLLVINRKGNLLSLVLALTSFPFLSLLANGNIEWIPALGFLLHGSWGLPLLLTKPQSGILAILSWDSFKKNYMPFFISAILVVIASFIIWKDWLSEMMINIQDIRNAEYGMSNWNFSPFPWLIPIGLGLIFYMIRYKPVDSEILGIFATFCLVPYFAAYSLTILFALLSASHRRVAAALWFLLWLYPLLSP